MSCSNSQQFSFKLSIILSAFKPIIKSSQTFGRSFFHFLKVFTLIPSLPAKSRCVILKSLKFCKNLVFFTLKRNKVNLELFNNKKGKNRINTLLRCKVFSSLRTKRSNLKQILSGLYPFRKQSYARAEVPNANPAPLHCARK